MFHFGRKERERDFAFFFVFMESKLEQIWSLADDFFLWLVFGE